MIPVLSERDILNLIEAERAKDEDDDSEETGIAIFAGEGDDKTSLIGKGFKIRHTDSGLTYTCIKLSDREDDSILIVKDDAIGDYYAIPSSDFSNYERM
jgi:hypothetical protein